MHTLGYSALGISLPLFVAHARGIFSDHGVSVRVRSWPNAHPLVEAILGDGEPFFGGFVAFPIAFHRHLNTRPLRYACAVLEDGDHPISFLLLRKGSGIERVEDLGDRNIGVLPTKAYREWLALLGRRHGLGYHQIVLDATCRCMQTSSDGCQKNRPTMRVYDVPGAETVEALRSGRVDAVFTNDPGVSAAVRAGVADVFGTEPILPGLLGDPYLFGSFVLCARFVDDHPDVARRVVRAIDDGIALVRRDPPRARRIAASYLPEGCADLGDGLGKPRFLTSDEVDAADLQALADRLAEERIVGGRLLVTTSILRGGASGSLPRRAPDALPIRL